MGKEGEGEGYGYRVSGVSECEAEAVMQKLDPSQVVTFEELLRAIMMEQDATRRVLVRKGL